jgi:hypothetical protein
VKYRVRAELGGRRFEEVMVDIGFSDPLGWTSETIRAPDLLAFADIEPIEVPIVPLEQHVAEKAHVYTRTYGQGHKSNLAKDPVDLVLVKQLMVLDAARLRSALVGVFEGRRQQGLPDRLPPPPTDWAVPYRNLAKEVGVDPDLQTEGRRFETCTAHQRFSPQSQSHALRLVVFGLASGLCDFDLIVLDLLGRFLSSSFLIAIRFICATGLFPALIHGQLFS